MLQSSSFFLKLLTVAACTTDAGSLFHVLITAHNRCLLNAGDFHDAEGEREIRVQNAGVSREMRETW